MTDKHKKRVRELAEKLNVSRRYAANVLANEAEGVGVAFAHVDFENCPPRFFPSEHKKSFTPGEYVATFACSNEQDMREVFDATFYPLHFDYFENGAWTPAWAEGKRTFSSLDEANMYACRLRAHGTTVRVVAKNGTVLRMYEPPQAS